MSVTDRSDAVGWSSLPASEDIRDRHSGDGIAKIAICRPEIPNTFQPQTLVRISDSLTYAREDASVGVILLPSEGGGPSAPGGGQSVRGDAGDLAVTADVSRFGQVDPEVGSFDGGFGAVVSRNAGNASDEAKEVREAYTQKCRIRAVRRTQPSGRTLAVTPTIPPRFLQPSGDTAQ